MNTTKVIIIAVVVAVVAYFGLNFARSKWADYQLSKEAEAGAGGGK